MSDFRVPSNEHTRALSDSIKGAEIVTLRARLVRLSDEVATLKAENAELHLALFHVENGCRHPDEEIAGLVKAALLIREKEDGDALVDGAFLDCSTVDDFDAEHWELIDDGLAKVGGTETETKMYGPKPQSILLREAQERVFGLEQENDALKADNAQLKAENEDLRMDYMEERRGRDQLEDENERLNGLVRLAYEEGKNHGIAKGRKRAVKHGRSWAESESKQALKEGGG